VISKVEPVPQFNACKAVGGGGESYFISKDREWIIEGILVKAATLKVSPEDAEKLRKRALFSVGSGEPIIVITNPLCKACRENRELITKLSRKYKLFFVPAGFDPKGFKASVDAYCRGKSLKDFFEIPPQWKVCDEGKLKVWTNNDILKKYSLTATPIFILPSGEIAVGIGELKAKLALKE